MNELLVKLITFVHMPTKCIATLQLAVSAQGFNYFSTVHENLSNIARSRQSYRDLYISMWRRPFRARHRSFHVNDGLANVVRWPRPNREVQRAGLANPLLYVHLVPNFFGNSKGLSWWKDFGSSGINVRQIYPNGRASLTKTDMLWWEKKPSHFPTSERFYASSLGVTR